MENLMEIEAAAGRLPREDFFEPIDRLENKAADLWDRQFERDAKEGRLAVAGGRALREHRAGLSKPFPDGEK